jgi:hypothetical protein
MELLLTGAISFAACVVIGVVFWKLVSPEVRFARVPVASISPPSDADHYLAYYRGASVQHYVHYFATDSTINQHLHDSAVLFVGSSRVLYAFPHETLQPFFAQRKLPYYVLGFLYGETSSFPLAIMQQQDLRPRWVVANADSFFSPRASDYARDLMRLRPINAFQVRFETDATFDVTRRLHQWLPHIKALRRISDEEISFRSRVDGTMEPLAAFHDPAPVVERAAAGASISAGELQTANVFKAEVEKRGGKLVLTYIPRTDSQRAEVEALARRLQVPLIAPRLENLQTLDRSHLDRLSAQRFSQAFLEEFAGLLDSDHR